ncbi:MAG: hypothetical protein FWD09_03295 [Lentimicrobiaceae bacterium]|nr:hypothetical protein [Lentimicrobiaceae bacterium]
MDDVLITGIVFFAIYKTIELFVRQKERRLMIEKMSEISPEVLQSNIASLRIAQNSGFAGNQFFSLRWAALLIGGSLGWPLGLVLYNTMQNNNVDMGYDAYSLTFVASIAFCAGIAMLIVYLIEWKANKDAKKKE